MIQNIHFFLSIISPFFTTSYHNCVYKSFLCMYYSVLYKPHGFRSVECARILFACGAQAQKEAPGDYGITHGVVTS